MGEVLNWIISGGFVIVSVFIKYLWKKHLDCEKDRAALWGVVNENQQDLAVFKGCQTKPCGALESLRRRKAFDALLKKDDTVSSPPPITAALLP